MIGGRTARLAAAGGVVLVLAVVATTVGPSGATPEPEQVPVVATDLVCPNAPTSSDRSTHTQVSAVTPSTLAASSGVATVGTLTDAKQLATISGRKHAAIVNTSTGTVSVVGSALAGRAPGFAVDQLTASTARGSHGLSGLTCDEPSDDFWFVGTGSGVGHTSALHLANAQATPATVDVLLYGKNGRIDAPGGLGLQVRAHGHRVVHLDRLAPGAGTLAVRVSATAGRVAAAVFDAEVDGLEPEGADWVPAAQSPARSVVVPGLGSGTGTRRLSVFVPGEGSTTVSVRLVGTQGSFAPTGAATVEVDRGTVVTVDLGEALARDQVAAVVTASVPLVAGVRWAATAESIEDLAFTAGAPALTGPAVIAGNHDAGGYASSLLLTAPDAKARVAVQQLVDGMPVGKRKVTTIGADRTVRVYLKAKTTGSFQTVVTPLDGGPVYGAVIRTHLVDHAAGTTVSVVRPARIAVDVPQARADLDVGLGR